LYLYCLREPADCASAGTCSAPGVIKAPAINGGRVFCRLFDGIEAVAGEVDGDFLDEMRGKAGEDVSWIKEKALAHELVVEEAMGLSGPGQDKTIPVIPVKFGVLFNSADRLAEVLRREEKAIKAVFNRIRGRQEWGVKLFLGDKRTFAERIRMESEDLSAKHKALAALPAGRAYFMEEEFNEELERACSRRLDEEALKIFGQLASLAEEAAPAKILDGKLTGRNERMVLNAAFLVSLGRLGRFKDAVADLGAQLLPEGFLVERGGPWPAYHFTEFAYA